MSEPKRKVSDPKLPDIPQCPRCGANILLGDTRCSKCGYNVQTSYQALREQSPTLVAFFLFGLGMLFVAPVLLTALTDGTLEEAGLVEQVLGVFGFLLVVAGGLYYAADLFILSANNKRKRP
jgi:hypothetical protein